MRYRLAYSESLEIKFDAKYLDISRKRSIGTGYINEAERKKGQCAFAGANEDDFGLIWIENPNRVRSAASRWIFMEELILEIAMHNCV